jgi:hypothetical protein
LSPIQQINNTVPDWVNAVIDEREETTLSVNGADKKSIFRYRFTSKIISHALRFLLVRSTVDRKVKRITVAD